MEKWLPAYGYEIKYEVSDRGRVRVIGKDQLGRSRYMGHILSPALCRGYVKYLLHKGDGSYKNVLVHILVAETFIGPRPDGMVVNHKDGNKANPFLENLEYVTPSQNHKHALQNKLFIPPSGKNHWSAVLSDEDVLNIRSAALGGESHSSIAKRYGCSIASVSAYRNGLKRAAALVSCQ